MVVGMGWDYDLAHFSVWFIYLNLWSSKFVVCEEISRSCKIAFVTVWVYDLPSLGGFDFMIYQNAPFCRMECLCKTLWSTWCNLMIYLLVFLVVLCLLSFFFHFLSVLLLTWLYWLNITTSFLKLKTRKESKKKKREEKQKDKERKEN